MGLSPSTQKLRVSADLTFACGAAYEDTLSFTQRAFPGLPRYQIASSSDRLYRTLTTLHFDVDGAIKKLGALEFREFAVDLYADVIVSNAQKVVMVKVPIGVVGIVGVRVVMRFGVGVVRAVIGVYVVGVAGGRVRHMKFQVRVRYFDPVSSRFTHNKQADRLTESAGQSGQPKSNSP